MKKDIRMFPNHCKGVHMSQATKQNNNRKSGIDSMSASQLLRQPNIHGNGHLLEQQFNTGGRFFNAREDFKMNKSSKLFRLGLVGAVVVSITFGQSMPVQQLYTKGSSLPKVYSEHVLEDYLKPYIRQPQKQVSTEERLKVKINSNNNAAQKLVKNPELAKTEKEKKAILIQQKQDTTKPSEHNDSNPTAPDMGDTRVVDGQKQVYFLGFGWVDDDNKPNEEITAKDMFENGNKVGNMEGSTVMDSDGDINKMVGTMGD